MRQGAVVLALGGVLLGGCSDDPMQSLSATRDGRTAGPPPVATEDPSAAAAPSYRASPSTASVPGPATGRPASAAPSRRAARATPAAAPSTARTTMPAPSASAGQASAAPPSTVPPTPASSPRPSGQLVITEADSGGTFTISRSTADALLRLGDDWLWSAPELDGSSVRLAQRHYVQDPGYAEWEIRPVAAGSTVIRSEGSLACHQAEPPCAAPTRLFEVTIVVS